MRKIVLVVTLLFMAVPAMAASNVTISCANDVNEVTVSYASDGNLIRAFGLDITVDTANITKVVPVDANYRIYPGQIVIVGGEVTDYNTPYAPGDLGDANATVEMGSLYTTDSNYASDPNAGYNMKPGTSGTLLKFYVDGDCNYTITENAALGGIVMEDPEEEPNVSEPNLCGGHVTAECYTGPDHGEWVTVGKPASWCFPRQCHGDADGIKNTYGRGGTQSAWVSIEDVAILVQGFREVYSGDPSVDPWIAADFDHTLNTYGRGGTQSARVSTEDVAILVTYFREPEVNVPADCLD